MGFSWNQSNGESVVLCPVISLVNILRLYVIWLWSESYPPSRWWWFLWWIIRLVLFIVNESIFCSNTFFRRHLISKTIQKSVLITSCKINAISCVLSYNVIFHFSYAIIPSKMNLSNEDNVHWWHVCRWVSRLRSQQKYQFHTRLYIPHAILLLIHLTTMKFDYLSVKWN